MKAKVTIPIYVTLLLFSITLTFSQSPNTVQGGEFVFNQDNAPCLSDEQQEQIRTVVAANLETLKLENRLAFNDNNRVPSPAFIWPIKKANGFAYNDVWGISNYVDQNPNVPDFLLDYNCGSKTYDLASGYNHRGVDIFTWPFGWKMMDDDSVEIIAAAAGQIIAKGDGQFDRNCGFNNDPWNAVYVQHNDGSVALYGHMKNGSLTTKNVGDSVAQGEFLGIVGSSGSSTGPHLHFEVYINSNLVVANLVDTYAGPCNSMNTESWWIDQKPYLNPGINAVLTHSAAPIFPACPTSETTHESDMFETTSTIYFAIYLRDQMAGTSVDWRIIRPNGIPLYTFNFPLTANYAASYWYWNYTGAANIPGTWTWEATYQGQTVTQTFSVETLSIDDNEFEDIRVYPNPSKDVVYINSNAIVKQATLTDVLGKTIKHLANDLEGVREVSLNDVSNGLYFLTLEGDINQKKTIRIIKQ